MALHLSPSVGHAPLLKKSPFQLAYRGGDVKAWQKKVRRKVVELIGLPENTHPSLKVRSLWKREVPDGVMEKIIFQSEPGVDVPCYWCTPRGVKPPYLTFICLQGHSTGMHLSIGVDREDEITPIEVKGGRDFGIKCMKQGMAALCVEQRNFGYRRELVNKTSVQHGCYDGAMRAMLLGRTMLGERVFDVDRAIDYLQSRGDIDMTRLGILGQSSGGTTSMFAGAVLPRIKAAMPGCSTAKFADSIATIHHCICNCVPGILDWVDMADLLGCHAPHPLVILNGKTDDIFPIASARATYRAVKKIYTAAGAASNVKFVEGPGGHDFYAALGWAAMRKLL